MTRPTAVTLARVSWIIPLVAFAIGMALRRPAGGHTADDPFTQGRGEGQACATLLFYVAGLVVGIVVLVASRKHGPEKIRTPAVVGVALNVVLFVIAIYLSFG